MARLHNITPQTLNDWLAAGSAVLVDVRNPDENAQCRIPGSVLIPLGACSAAALPPSGGKKLVFHCKSGKRSLMACGACMDALPADMDVYNLENGIEGWKAAGYPCDAD